MRREDDGVKLYHRHRDMEEQVLTIEFDKETCRWNLLEERTPAENVFMTDPDLRKAMEYMATHEEFYGTALEFCKLIGSSKKPQSISGKLQNRKHQLEKMGILFEKKKHSDGMHLTLINVRFKKSEDVELGDLPIEI